MQTFSPSSSAPVTFLPSPFSLRLSNLSFGPKNRRIDDGRVFAQAITAAVISGACRKQNLARCHLPIWKLRTMGECRA